MAISKQQSMRPAEIELIDATNQHESTLQAYAQSLETLDKSLTAETTDRKSADTALGTRIENETQARTDADTELGTRIDNEAQARTDADTELGTRIDNEAQARTSSDANLQGQIDALVAVGAEPNVIDSISVNGVAQPVTGKNVDITASSVVDGNAIAPSSVAAAGNVSDSVGSIAELRDSVAHVYQPIRPDKKDLLGVDTNDRNSPLNQPHVVRADDVSTLQAVPPGITSGPLYGLWDCYVMDMYEGGHAQILVTFREMVPVSGRVWTNWYNYQQWDGWKSLTPQ